MIQVMAKAPLRLGLAGGGTDVDPYCSLFGGEVLSVTIARFVHVRLSLSLASSESAVLRFCSSDRATQWEGSWQSLSNLDALPALRLHAAVLRRMLKMANNRLSSDLDLLLSKGWHSVNVTVETATDAPMGSGLGTSSTLVVAMLQAWQQALRLPWGEYEIARQAWEIERLDCGLQGGRQDQYAASFGGLIDMQFRPDGVSIVNPLPVEDALLHELEASLVLYFTGVSRESAQIIANQSQRVEQGLHEAIEATHAVKEQARRMKRALLASNMSAVSTALAQGWDAKKRLSGAISNPQIEATYEAAMAAGAFAGKVSGAGGGGFMFFICDPMRRPQLMTALEQHGGQAFSCAFYLKGAEAWRVGQ
jgi:D-glycero-alpha-D-manno-heptose-7-phosphate kinase